jgi:hypothetical protein
LKSLQTLNEENMAEVNTASAPAPAAPASSTPSTPSTPSAPPSVAVISLDAYCAALTKRTRQPELVGGFKHVEKAAGKVKATREQFDLDFKNFCGAKA